MNIIKLTRNNAIKYFNKARRDYKWGELSLTNMIEIYVCF